MLVLDKQTKDIIAPLLKISDLRKYGVTLHLMISTERQSIPDVPAIYFVDATEENIRLITNVRNRPGCRRGVTDARSSMPGIAQGDSPAVAAAA